MHGRRSALVVAALAGVICLAIGGLLFTLLERRTNREILGELDRLGATLNPRGLEKPEAIATLESASARMAELERRHPSESKTILPIEPVLSAPPPLLESNAIAPYAEHSAIESPDTLVAPLEIRWSTDWSAYQPAGLVAPPQVAAPRKITHPVFVKGMYSSFVALQAADIITTTRALNRGGIEANPFARGYVSSPAAMIGVKAGVTIGTIFITEKLRKEHPVQASMLMVTVNAMLAAVVINNASVNFDP